MERRHAAIPWGLPKNPTLLLTGAAAAQTSESGGKEGRLHLNKTFRSNLTGVGCTSACREEQG